MGRSRLQGLVKCGGCGARYVGDPCHRRFCRRCLNPCGRKPSIGEHILDEAVISAAERLIQNPPPVMEQIERLNKHDPAAEVGRQTELSEAETELKRIETEEARLLEPLAAGDARRKVREPRPPQRSS